MKHISHPLAAAAALLCSLIASAQTYKLTIALTEAEEGAQAVLVDTESGARLDSALVADARASFSGTLAAPTTAEVEIDGSSVAGFFLEPGDITVTVTHTEIPGGVRTDYEVSGGTLNTAKRSFFDTLKNIRSGYQTATPAEKERLSARLGAVIDSTMTANADNVFGAWMFTHSRTPDSFVAEHPSLARFASVQRLLERRKKSAAVKVGAPFVDFSVSYDGTTHRLSDVVGHGKYVLLDFWASWCGPCRQSMPALKELYSKYSAKGFTILGIAVNDRPADTRHAIEALGLPWETWLNEGADEATEIYNVEYIPTTYLFGPDGTILLIRPDHEELAKMLAEKLG